MDPITAVQVVGSALGFVDFATRLLSCIYDVYKSPEGLTSRYVQVSVISNDLHCTSKYLQEKLALLPSEYSNDSDRKIGELCMQCMDIAKEVQETRGKLRARGTTKLDYAKSSFVVAAKAFLPRSRVQELEKILEQIRAEIVMTLIASLWEDGNSIRAILDTILLTLNGTDRRVESISKDLKGLTLPNSAETRLKQKIFVQHLWDANWQPKGLSVPNHSEDPADDQIPQQNILRQIISSLSFDEINNRQSMIQPAYAKTFKWIFPCTDDQHHKPASLPAMSTWLESQDDSIYWITGKPGSGKPTLMSYITTNPSLVPHLRIWARNLPHLAAWYYFWDAGSVLEKSKEGLLRRLLWQCIGSRPDIVEKVCGRRWLVARAFPDAELQLPEWDLTELEESFRSLLLLSGQMFRLALFIDGLDEFSGDHRELMGWIHEINQNYDVKICVASRNWPEFSDLLSQGPHLKMENLTQADIQADVAGRFAECGGFRDLQPIYPSECQSLLDNMVQKAQGVFLWVRLVVKSLTVWLDKRRLGDLKELQNILDELPTEMDALCTRIWNSIDPVDIGTTARLFRLLEATFLRLEGMSVWLALGNLIPRQTDGTISEETAEHIRRYVRQGLDMHTRGILEITPRGIVHVLHRSAADWLAKPAMWNDVCSKSPLGFDPLLALLKVGVARLSDKMRLRTDHPTIIARHFWHIVTIYMCHGTCVGARPQNEKVLIETLDELDSTATRIANKIDLSNSDPLIKGRPGPDFVGGPCYNPCHWVNRDLWFMPSDKPRKEYCFVGLASQFSILPYVKAKLSQNPDLLKTNSKRVSLLESAVFCSQPPSVIGSKSIYGMQIVRRRFETIKYLLGCGASRRWGLAPSTTYFFKSSLCKHQILGAFPYSVGNPEEIRFYKQINNLFEQHMRRTRVIRFIFRHRKAVAAEASESWEFRTTEDETKARRESLMNVTEL
ncbi:uncharacterized protein Z519_06644 [Cladophialophora bantiana CBS 173.52]|uniref:Nephrocystin 3-like N-terminal domain-containing protein n=1 Tax=Cladophialophora bantiana (strain ATCC 10958 / CBS 173.52 / CDC B-1940 / NIH 8579) TaxID=1442370 RepID=A0A0D2HPL7_CLAB1|nr:uncharacterized protein Z519_06644 [Cladophialophora bantiana CBS 173.52]KIW92795.1 hypothetical protein Z519_06644 [Cladophialophora bantiana CBS 173.52]